uniref:Cyanophycinase n=1 Tax=Cyanothece sp. (strain PCC 7425 / ATCC 29141) TaxID=395961 RepID=B8HQN0_CYAP4
MNMGAAKGEMPDNIHLLPTVMAIGGAEDKIQDRLILRTFIQLAGDSEAQILIIPAASEDPVGKGQFYSALFEQLGAKSTTVLISRDRSEAEDPDLLASLHTYSGVFISGGDQSRLSTLYAHTTLVTKLQMLVRSGKLILAGTSAGAAVMGYHMIAGGSSGAPPNPALVELSKGFGILPHAIVDQHFHNRNRLARLISAIALQPGVLGIGIDEDTCAMVNPAGHLTVLGKGVVTILDPSHTSSSPPNGTSAPTEPANGDKPLTIYNLRMHLLSHGDNYHLPGFKPVPAHL